MRMRRALIATLVSLAALPALAAEDIVLRGMGSFHVGGRIAEVSGKEVRQIQRQPGGPMTKLDPNGQYMVEQMYVQYFLPKNRKGKYPLLMWHGGGLTGVTYESTPDGRDGWLNYFVRRGWDVYNSDAVERGRSGFASGDVWSDAPIFLTYQDPFERFRIGQGEGSWNADAAKRKLLPGSAFPAEAYENYMRQAVPRWLGTDKAIVAAYLALVDKVCPCVMLLHSQGGTFGFQVAEQRPDKIKGIVAVEAASPGNIANAPKLKDVPVLQIFGDYVDQHPRWSTFKKVDMAYGEAIKAAGGNAEWINLPDIGIAGNSHMVMHDKNSDQVAEVIQKWFVTQGLSE
jgi:pimeloyl-ACP methyl ester carboxylesterase